MLNFETTTTIQSKAFPGVSFTVRKLNMIERAKRDSAITEKISEHDDLVVEYQAEMEKGDDKDLKVIADLAKRFGYTSNLYLKPPFIKAAFVSVDGMTLDGKPITADSLIASGPEELIDEVFTACREQSGLTGEQEKNSSSSSDSVDPAGEAKSNTTAEPVVA